VRKNICLAVYLLFILILIPAYAFAEINLNISDSTTTIIDSSTFKMNNITADVDGVAVAGQYWIDFKWDPGSLVFVPINAGAEETPNIIGTWLMTADWTCDGTTDATSYWTINSDNTVSSSSGKTGAWTLKDNNVTITFETTHYTGTINAANDTISGNVSTNLDTGCWTATKTTPVQEKTWNFWVYNSSTSYTVTLKSNANRTFTISFTPGTGNPNVCFLYDYKFIQGNNTLSFSIYQNLLDSNTALFISQTGWDGCDYVYQGQTASGTISNMPTWFNFNTTFKVGVNSGLMILEPDGSAHK
jgi:hypothetical protein